mmetsp:Transcript_65438/g.124801  ORF Transcript_65438/g.124801 Transcript_65438/m.124801 type:complete len:328 (-) Transcript_65438:155-1138(-)
MAGRTTLSLVVAAFLCGAYGEGNGPTCYGVFANLVTDEGNDVGQPLWGQSTEQCRAACTANERCRSFSFCPQWGGGWMKDKALTGNEATHAVGDCRTFFQKPCPPAADDEAFIREWSDDKLGVAFTMVSPDGWRSGKWGVVQEPLQKYTPILQTYVSITTRAQDMATYQNRPYGLALHITEDSEFWKDFQVIGHGQNRIVGGPGDGGSHTPGSPDWRLQIRSDGVDYGWFTWQKNEILKQYNTVYRNHDYNEFITNGVSSSSIAGVFMYLRSSWGDQQQVNDQDLCHFLNMNAPERTTPWPVYGYNWGEMKIIRYLPCGGLSGAVVV